MTDVGGRIRHVDDGDESSGSDRADVQSAQTATQRDEEPVDLAPVSAAEIPLPR